MKLTEYKAIENLTYSQYCAYLQKKYGIAPCAYLNESWNKNKACTRTSEGLLCHHKYEDHAQKLCDPEIAKQYPYEWQLAENIVYCDYLEHLLLHILICEEALDDANPVGIGGILQYLIPELNDVYSGWITKQAWRKACHDVILDDKELYLVLLKRFKETCKTHPLCRIELMFSSCNAKYALWDSRNNHALFEEIKKL